MKKLLNITKIKKLIEWLNLSDLRGSFLADKVLSFQDLVMNMAYNVFASRITWCLPCNIRRAKDANERRRVKRELVKSRIQKVMRSGEDDQNKRLLIGH